VRKLVLALSLVAFVVPACGGEKEKEKEQASKPCPAPPPPVSSQPKLPARFPKPKEVTYTAAEQAGPSTKVSGYWSGDVDSAFEGYKDAFSAAGWDVSKDEREAVDAEIAFAHGSANGQVKLLQTCAGRTSVTITLRPE
jgi:hypothetical protein